MPAPERTPQQRQAALQQARADRAVRAQARAELKAGRQDPIEFLQNSAADSRLAAMRVRDFLLALPGIGTARADQLMHEFRIAGSRRLQGLGPKQRVALSRWLAGTAESKE